MCASSEARAGGKLNTGKGKGDSGQLHTKEGQERDKRVLRKCLVQQQSYEYR